MKKTLMVFAASAALAAQAGFHDRPAGFKIGSRMTIMPYVSLYYTWDSNVDSSHHQESSGNSSFNISPGFTATYKGDNWSIDGSAYYQYHAYTDNAKNLNQHSFGQNLGYTYSNSKDGGRGWTLVLRESFAYISQDDDMTNDGGRGIGRDRWQAQFAGTLQRRFTEKWHGDVNASYYYLDYVNDSDSYAPLYGWQRYTVGLQGGYAASRWTDILLLGNYQGYLQDNTSDPLSGTSKYRDIDSSSQGWTVHVGLGSYATERISYRLTGGWSYFRYADGLADMNGFTYTVSGHWRMTDRWNMMLLASSYYQPSETSYSTASRTDSFSWGLAHSMIRDKLTATLDLSYRHQKTEYAAYASDDLADDIITARFGLNYTFNRYIGIFGHAEYQTSFTRGDYVEDNCYDYDRWRLSVGLRLTY